MDRQAANKMASTIVRLTLARTLLLNVYNDIDILQTDARRSKATEKVLGQFDRMMEDLYRFYNSAGDTCVEVSEIFASLEHLELDSGPAPARDYCSELLDSEALVQLSHFIESMERS